jgi:hypothetical protein
MFAYSLRATLSACICLFIERDVSSVIPSRGRLTEARFAEIYRLRLTRKGHHGGQTGFTPSAFSPPERAES